MMQYFVGGIYTSILISRFSTHHNESFSSLKHTSSFYTIFNSIREQQTFQEKKDNTIRKSGNNSFPLVCSDKREKGRERERKERALISILYSFFFFTYSRVPLPSPLQLYFSPVLCLPLIFLPTLSSFLHSSQCTMHKLACYVLFGSYSYFPFLPNKHNIQNLVLFSSSFQLLLHFIHLILVTLSLILFSSSILYLFLLLLYKNYYSPKVEINVSKEN